MFFLIFVFGHTYGNKCYFMLSCFNGQFEYVNRIIFMKILRSICTVLPVLLLSSCMQRDALKVADECYADYVGIFSKCL